MSPIITSAPPYVSMFGLYAFLTQTYPWLIQCRFAQGLHFSMSSVIDTDSDKHHMLNQIPADLLMYIQSVLPLEYRQRRLRSLSIMVTSATGSIGAHRDQTWVSALNKPFHIWNLSDGEYSVMFSRVKPPVNEFTVTVPAWSRYCVQGEFRCGYLHAVAGSHRRVLVRIGWF